MIIAFTGHRIGRMPLDSEVKIRAFLEGMRDLHGENLRVISGMAHGVDQLAANIAVELGVPYTAAVPWVGFAGNWEPAHRESYLGLLEKAERVCVTADVQEYRPWVYQKRDEWMVDNSDLLASVWDGVEAGGTWNTIKYARKRGLQDRIMYLAEGK